MGIRMKFTILLAAIGLAEGKKLHHHHTPEYLQVQGDHFYPFEKGMLGGKTYERVIPKNFEGDGDDIFIRSVLKNYALEGKTEDKDDKEKDGLPTGVFTLDETQGKALASEVLCTHKGLCGDKLKTYMDTYWAKSWGHFDV